MLPSHKVKPEGMAFAAPDHIIIIPVGMDTIPVRADPSIAGKAPVILDATTCPELLITLVLPTLKPAPDCTRPVA